MLLASVVLGLVADDGMRMFLFIMVLVAVVLILVGGIIAASTLYSQFKEPSSEPRERSRE